MSNPRLNATHGRQSPARAVVSEFAAIGTAIYRWLARDPLSTLLLVASLALLITFFSLLGRLGPQAEGQPVSLTNISALAGAQRVRETVLLDHDHQVQVLTDSNLKLYADYPSSDAGTEQLMHSLAKGGAEVRVDPQNGQAAILVIEQFLIP